MSNNFQGLYGASFWPNDVGVLGIFFQLGLLGLILYIILMIKYLKKGIRTKNFTLTWMSISLITSPWLLVFPGLYYLVDKLNYEKNLL